MFFNEMEIKVFLNRSSDKPVFMRLVSFNESIEIDTNQILKVMRVLFGSECVVQFNFYV